MKFTAALAALMATTATAANLRTTRVLADGWYEISNEENQTAANVKVSRVMSWETDERLNTGAGVMVMMVMGGGGGGEEWGEEEERDEEQGVLCIWTRRGGCCSCEEIKIHYDGQKVLTSLASGVICHDHVMVIRRITAIGRWR